MRYFGKQAAETQLRCSSFIVSCACSSAFTQKCTVLANYCTCYCTGCCIGTGLSCAAMPGPTSANHCCPWHCEIPPAQDVEKNNSEALGTKGCMRRTRGGREASGRVLRVEADLDRAALVLSLVGLQVRGRQSWDLHAGVQCYKSLAHAWWDPSSGASAKHATLQGGRVKRTDFWNF